MMKKSDCYRSARPLTKAKWAMALSILVCMGLVGCADREAINQSQAALELAEMKGDLDGMYLALRRLDELGVRDATTRLPGIQMAVEFRERMFRAVADRDHEQALLAANALLDQIPDDKDALKILRTSGHIFWYLQKAADELATFGLILEEPTVPLEDVAWSPPDGLDEEQHQVELNKLAQKALADLGKYSGEIDGKIGAKTNDALSSIARDMGIEHSGIVDIDLVQALRVAARRKQLRGEQIDQSFVSLAKARQNIAKAKQLDPSFKNVVQLEEMTDGALGALVYLQGAQIIQSSETLVQMAAYLYQTIQGAMSGSTGRRLSPSDVWKHFQPIVSEFRDDAGRTLEDVATMNRRLAQNSGGGVEVFAAAVNEFYMATKLAIDACTDPSGSVLDYRRDANAALQRYKESSARLQNALPSTQDIESSVEALSIALQSYSLSSDPAIKQIVEERVDDLST